MALIFNGLQPPRMAVLPCTVRSLPKNGVFEQAAGIILQEHGGRVFFCSSSRKWLLLSTDPV
jgi:hypothetical protein